MALPQKHSDIPASAVRKLFDETIKTVAEMVEEVLKSSSLIDAREARQVMAILLTRLNSNQTLEKLYKKEFDIIKVAFHKIEVENKRKDFFGRFMIYPVEDKIADARKPGFIYRPLIPDYVKSLKSMLGINYVETKQREALLITEKFRIGDSVDWDKIYDFDETKKIILDIANEIRLRFKEPRAIQFMLHRMNSGQFYAKSTSKYTVDDLNSFMRFLYRIFKK